MAWTDEKKQKAISLYKDGNPTPQNSAELVKQIADELEESPNGVRLILTGAGVYVKKEATTPAKSSEGKSEGKSSGGTRVSKEAQHEALKEQLRRLGAEVDEDIISKLTGKAAAYFSALLAKLN